MKPGDRRDTTNRRRWLTQLGLRRTGAGSSRSYTKRGRSSLLRVNAESVELISVDQITYLVVNVIPYGPIIFPLSPAQLQKFRDLSRGSLRSTLSEIFSTSPMIPSTSLPIPLSMP